MSVVGLLLAGGLSSRFGSEKAVAPHGAGQLMDAPLQALIGACDEVAVSARATSQAALTLQACDYTVLQDPHDAPAGPLAGVLAGLAWAARQGASHLATAPCDAALLRVDQMVALIEAAGEGASVAASGADLQPLIAVWPVDRARALLQAHFGEQRHPSVKSVLAELGAATVPGFDDVNVNTPQDLSRLPAGDAGADDPEHARLFQFENDFVRTLRCIPMCVRFKLDRAGIKLTLRQWSRFTLSDRDRLRRLGCEPGPEAAAYRAALEALVLERSNEAAKALGEQPAPSWRFDVVPPEIVAFAQARGVPAPSDAGWRGLSELERYVLIKLTRDKHENANFAPAMREFGVL